MSHLNDVGHTYFSHLKRAWKLSFVLFVHGLFPNIWETKASDEICNNNNNANKSGSRAYMLKHMYGIEEKDDRL